MNEIYASPFLGIGISVFAYLFGIWLHKKTNVPLVNPMAVSVCVVIFLLLVLRIPIEKYEDGTSFINVLLLPATVCLAVRVYSQRATLRKNSLVILSGCAVGAIVSVGSVLFFGKLFGLQDVLLQSSLPKSATTPIAMEISGLIGGIPSVTVALVVVTGITAALIGPILIKICRLKNSIATGVALGTSGHAIGTSEALKLGSDQGAVSGVSIVITGLSLFAILFFFQ